MSKKFAALILAAFAVGLAAPADAQSLPTPQSWPKNRMPDKPSNARRVCILNAGPNYDKIEPFLRFEGAEKFDQSERVGKSYSDWLKDASHAGNPYMPGYPGRAFLKGPGEGDYWVNLNFPEYYCRSFAAGTPVSIYVQRKDGLGRWGKLCIYGVKPEQHDVTLVLDGNGKLGTLGGCAFPLRSEVTHWD